jgi:ribonucleoside-diphosphate reductase alpha chain
MRPKTESRNFETMYFAAVTASMEMAKEGVFKFCRISYFTREFQYNLWGLTDADLSGRWDWASFVKKLWSTVFAHCGGTNATASTSQILGNRSF